MDVHKADGDPHSRTHLHGFSQYKSTVAVSMCLEFKFLTMILYAIHSSKKRVLPTLRCSVWWSVTCRLWGVLCSDRLPARCFIRAKVHGLLRLFCHGHVHADKNNHSEGMERHSESAHLHQGEPFTFCIPLIGRIRIRTWNKIESACLNTLSWYCGCIKKKYIYIYIYRDMCAKITDPGPLKQAQTS